MAVSIDIETELFFFFPVNTAKFPRAFDHEYYGKQGNGNSAKGKEEQKPVTTVALDRVCVRAWLRHVWRCMCACIWQENVYVKEKMCMHTAVRCWQLNKKKKTTPWLNWRSDSTTLRKSKKKTSNLGMIMIVLVGNPACPTYGKGGMQLFRVDVKLNLLQCSIV